MRDKLRKIREPKKISGKKAGINTLLIFAFGVALGIVSKWLDNLAFDDTIAWHRPIEMLDLGNFFSEIGVWLLIALTIAIFSASALRAAINVFAFFAGSCVAYHLWTIVFSGFNPTSYMMIWYGITILSPILAILCWYAKGSGTIPIILDIGIMAIFTLACFSIGFFYVDPESILYMVVYVAAIVVLYKNPKQLIVSVLAGFILAFALNPFWPYH